MLRIILAISSLVFLISCTREDVKKFSVTGTVKNREVKMIYLEEMPVAAMQSQVVDSATVSGNGKFSLKAKTGEESIFNIRVDNDMYPFVSLINDSEKITVDVDFNNEGNENFYTIQGSAASREVKNYLSKSGRLMRDLYYAGKGFDSLQKAKAADSLIVPVQIQYGQIMQELKDFTSQSIRGATSPGLAMFILRTYQGNANNPSFRIESFDNETVGNFLNELAIKFPEHEGIASIKRSFDSQVSPPAGLVGQNAPEIVLPDTEGNEIKLSSFRGKYVLVDFWASWCKPCRLENPNVVNAFNKYRNKNFTILGVSLDQKKEPWMKAIVDDKLNWTHISDLKYWGSRVVPLYQIQGIPYNVLVDPNGKVIAENLRGPGLHEKLEEVLQ